MDSRSSALILEKKLKNLSHSRLQKLIKKYNGGIVMDPDALTEASGVTILTEPSAFNHLKDSD